MLGGAGPAVAAVPLSMLWGLGNIYSLLHSIYSGTTGPIAAAQQVVYVPLMAFALVSRVALCRGRE